MEFKDTNSGNEGGEKRCAFQSKAERADDVALATGAPQGLAADEGTAGAVSELGPAFGEFVEAIPDAVILAGDRGRIVLVNRLAEALFGYSRQELLGQSVDMLIPQRHRTLHSHHEQNYFAAPRTRPMEAVRPLTGLRKDGVEMPLEISLSPLKTPKGTLVIALIRDLTQRLGAEAKFRGFLESAPDAVVVVDRAGVITIVNTLTEKMFGYGRDELLGQPVELLVPERFRERHVRDRDNYSRAPRTRPMGAGQELWGRRKDGAEFPVEISLSPLETEQGTLITSIIRDITERRNTEERIKASLREKEVLLKEIHHRVKNNLQVTSSLLKLQSGYIQDEQARQMFADSQNRIRSMALVHEKLYQSSDLSRVNFSEYVESLAALLFRSYGVDASLIQLRIEAGAAFLSIETAVPCGLILNELLSNSLKHAFPHQRHGQIRVRVAEDKAADRLTLSVSDNGVGLGPGFNIEKSESLGLQLVRTLARQLNGQLEVTRNGWTEFKLQFPIPKGP